MNNLDAEQIQNLVDSPIRSDAREEAFQKWSAYKLSRQMDCRIDRKRTTENSILGKSGDWTKGDYIKSLTAPAIDLSDAEFTDVCLGYVDLRGAVLDRANFSLNNLYWTAFKGTNFKSASFNFSCVPAPEF